jgi:hypothetical protein
MNLSPVLILVEPHDPDGGLAGSLSLVDPIVRRGARLLPQLRRRSPILTHRASRIPLLQGAIPGKSRFKTHRLHPAQLNEFYRQCSR